MDMASHSRIATQQYDTFIFTLLNASEILQCVRKKTKMFFDNIFHKALAIVIKLGINVSHLYITS